ncbi:MAG: LLM class flavin-dependent oxidoreductase [Bdellovibrionaceae bacterium]|nr:LLM class flavin-dependent oxidoreductase [Pseudobdellovibrionaceae bacterium]
MKYDLFLSICQTEVDGFMPDEKTMFANFFDQAKLADELGFGTAWIAETHLSCQVQKENPGAVIPHFTGEIGLNTDILQMAHVVFANTKNINVGSAIRNIICNGGPIAHAEAVRTFLSLRRMSDPTSTRKLELGFAAGRFPFSNTPYGFKPKGDFETETWEVLKNKYFQEAVEIFLRLLKGEKLSSENVSARTLTRADFRKEDDWHRALVAAKAQGLIAQTEAENIPLAHHWNFEKVGVIPFDAPLENLRLTIGSHDPETQNFANTILPVGVFNLSITPPAVIEETHQRMAKTYNNMSGGWTRDLMPRTVLCFLDDTPGISETEQSVRAKRAATRAWENYWRAMEKTLDPKKVEGAVSNTIAGNVKQVAALIREKYHPEDRLMLWFDFNNHDNENVKSSMRAFMQKVKPLLEAAR